MNTDITKIPTGYDVIQGYLRTLDGSPGVYRMLDSQARVLYVGKARSLKNRVSNYARPSGHSARIASMISHTASMMFLTTNTETEALLLEQNLIKQLKHQAGIMQAAAVFLAMMIIIEVHRKATVVHRRGHLGACHAVFL
jgi:excinuclease ABC subunit C